MLHRNVKAHVFMVDYRGYGDRFSVVMRSFFVFVDFVFRSQGDPSEAALQQVSNLTLIFE
jgi:hypothetical protein